MHGVKSFIHLCPARATQVRVPWWPLAPAWPQGQLGVATITTGRDVPWPCPSPAHTGEMSFSGNAWTGQGGWKRPTHIVLPSTDPQVAWRTFPDPGWFSKSYGLSMCTPAKEISRGDFKKPRWQQCSHTTGSLLCFCPMPSSALETSGQKG